MRSKPKSLKFHVSRLCPINQIAEWYPCVAKVDQIKNSAHECCVDDTIARMRVAHLPQCRMFHVNVFGLCTLWPFVDRNEDVLFLSHMAVAYGIVYSLYRSHPNVPMPADVPQGCCVRVLGSGRVGKDDVVTGAEYAGAL